MTKDIVSAEVVATKILFIRGRKVMLDRDLAELYGVSVKRLNEQVKRNAKRFPADFMFQLNKEEVGVSRSQIATLNEHIEDKEVITITRGRNIKYLPYVFTEQGVAMLSTVLNSDKAIQVNIAIMRAFVKLREFLLTHKELAQKLEELERKYNLHEKDVQMILEVIKQLMTTSSVPEKPKIGFHS
ncbi:MAG: ORF6N domain-containing protein [Candidatus Omnitrophica bacterium]|nr:ORF6N domain-containing protein [Candidatus Omnitrophota bacterium]